MARREPISWVRQVGWASIPIIFYSIGLLLFTGRRALERSSGDWRGAVEIMWSALWPALVLLGAIYGTVGYVSWLGTKRAALLSTSRNAQVVLPAARTSALVSALDQAGIVGVYGTRPRDFGYGLTVVARKSGIEVWGGSHRDPSKYLSWGWRDVVDISQGVVPDGFRTSRCLTFDIIVRGSTTTIPIVITGGGPGGIFPLSARKLEVLAREIRDSRVGT